LNLYTPLFGPDSAFVLTDRKGNKLEEIKGKMMELVPPTYYSILTEKGITEIIKLKPYRENESMEQSGRAVALFYVIDDPSVRKELLSGKTLGH
jgi:hypothetical protein